MKTLTQQYESAKKKAFTFMQQGKINAYLTALAEMNAYKKLMTGIVLN